MKLLLDTHVLLWVASAADRLGAEARARIEDMRTEPVFSVASLWEVAIKRGLGRADFQVEPSVLRRGLLDNGYVELPVTGAHAVVVSTLPALHRDPFDRMLVAQALVEGMALMTADPKVAVYPGRIFRI